MQKRTQRAAPARTAPHQVRIIGGRWKRTPLAVPDAAGLRPTPDRVRETVFNWLNHLLDGEWQRVRCLDLFAGSGALGFEAASRGAQMVTLVDDNPAALRQMQAARDKLRADEVRIVRGDGIRLARGWAAEQGPQAPRFELIFVDPPYQRGWLEQALPLCARILVPGGLVYVEAEYDLAMPADDGDGAAPWLAEWQIVRADRAGMVFYHLLQRKSGP